MSFNQSSFENRLDNVHSNKLNKITLSIEGNIGCGKSTFVSMLEERLSNMLWIKQPVSQWQNIGGKSLNLLEKYYQEATRWGFTFQIYALFTRFQHLTRAIHQEPEKLIACERSICTDKFVFSELMRELNYMDETQYSVFLEFYKNYDFQLKSLCNSKIIYLRCSPQKCYERIKSRGRSQQSQISLQYLNKIHQKHQKWLMNQDPNDLLIIDTTIQFQNDKDRTKQIIQQFNSFLNKKQ